MELTTNAILSAFSLVVKGTTPKTNTTAIWFLLALNKGNEHIMYLTVISRYYRRNA